MKKKLSKYTISSSFCESKEKALKTLQAWYDERRLKKGTKLFEIGKSWTLEELIEDLKDEK